MGKIASFRDDSRDAAENDSLRRTRFQQKKYETERDSGFSFGSIPIIALIFCKAK
jgi:hypothetical protein